MTEVGMVTEAARRLTGLGYLEARRSECDVVLPISTPHAAHFSSMVDLLMLTP